MKHILRLAAGALIAAVILTTPAHADDKPGQEVCQPQDAHVQVGADTWTITVPEGQILVRVCVKYGTTVEYFEPNLVGPATLVVDRDKDISHGIAFFAATPPATTTAASTTTVASTTTTQATTTVPEATTTTPTTTPATTQPTTAPSTTPAPGSTVPPSTTLPTRLPDTGLTALGYGFVIAALILLVGGLTLIRHGMPRNGDHH